MFRLLFPAGTHEMPPTEEFITAYDAVLGNVLSQDGIMYYTEDRSVIRYRAELYRELLSNRTILTELREFVKHFRLSENESGEGARLLADLTIYKENLEAVRKLRNYLYTIPLYSSAMNLLKEYLNQTVESEKWRKAEETFAKIPKDIFHIKSITLGINLDSGGNAHEAGIVSVNPYYFVSNHPLEKLLRLGDDLHPTEPLLKPDREHTDLYFELNRELMRAADRVIGKELRKLHADHKLLLKNDIIGKDLLNELRFVVESADLMIDLIDCGAQIEFINRDHQFSKASSVDISKTIKK